MTGCDERGTTAVELVIASALTVLLLGLVLPIVITAHRATGRSILEDRLHGDARHVVIEVVRRLRSARPPAVCTDPPGAPLEGCRRLGGRLATLLQARSDLVCFASVPNSRDGDGASVLPSPDLVCLGRRAGTDELAVTTWGPTASATCLPGETGPASYTTPCWEYPQPRTDRTLGRLLAGADRLFRYRSRSGAVLSPPGPGSLSATTDDAVLTASCAVDPCIATELAAIARIEVDLRLGYTERGRRRELRLLLDVAPRGAALVEEQTWAVG